MELNEGELRGAIDSDIDMEPALLGADISDIDVKVADPICLELLFGGPVASHIGQSADAMALQAAMER